MARKITHTKSGTYYNGPTGRRKAFSLTDIMLKASKSSSKVSSKKDNTNATYLNNSEGDNSKNAAIVIVAIVVVIISFVILIFNSHSSSSKSKHRHRNHYRTEITIEDNKSLIAFQYERQMNAQEYGWMS